MTHSQLPSTVGREGKGKTGREREKKRENREDGCFRKHIFYLYSSLKTDNGDFGIYQQQWPVAFLYGILGGECNSESLKTA